MSRVRGEAGFTLVETLLAVAILVATVTTVFGILYAGQGGSKAIAAWSDQTQQLRVALRQMADDLSNVSYFGDDPDYDLTVLASQPLADNSGWEESLSRWPGDLIDWQDVLVSYTIRGDKLVRDVSDAQGLVSSQVLVEHLEPGSLIQVDPDNPKVIHVKLRKAASGGQRIAEVQSDFFLR